MDTKTLIVIRHAHRDKKEGRELDNGLSAKGRKQARQALAFFKKRFKGVRGQLFSSPKKRCVETLAPIARYARTKVTVDPELDEGGNLEGKAQRFLQRWHDSPAELTVISSHGDWIPVFTEIALGTSIDISKGGWLELVRDGEDLRLTWLVQRWDI